MFFRDVELAHFSHERPTVAYRVCGTWMHWVRTTRAYSQVAALQNSVANQGAP